MRMLCLQALNSPGHDERFSKHNPSDEQKARRILIVLICIYLIRSEVKNFYIFFLAICISSSMNLQKDQMFSIF